MDEDEPILSARSAHVRPPKMKNQINNLDITNTKSSMDDVIKTLNEDGKDRIDRTVLKSFSSFGGRPYVNMKEFLKIIKDNPIEKLNALYNLVEADSDSIIGFVELNGLAYIHEWLTRAIQNRENSFIACILQFLCHDNLTVSYHSLNATKIPKTVSSLIGSKTEKLTHEIKSHLPSKLRISKNNDNFIEIINREAIHNLCNDDGDIDSIRFVQSQFAQRIMTKWNKVVKDHKRRQKRPFYRTVAFADEKGKEMEFVSEFRKFEAPIAISNERDQERRKRMKPSIPWYFPLKMYLEPIENSTGDGCIPDSGKSSKERKTEYEREEAEFEDFPIGDDPLDDPKILKSATVIATAKDLKNIIDIPLETEATSPAPSPGASVGQLPNTETVAMNHTIANNVNQPPFPHPTYVAPHPAHAPRYPPPPHAYTHGPHVPHAPHPMHNNLGHPPPPPPHGHYMGHPHAAPPHYMHHQMPPPGMTGPPPHPHGHYPPHYLPPPNMMRPSAPPPPNAQAHPYNPHWPSNNNNNNIHNKLTDMSGNNGNNHRRREFAIDNRPAKRQKLNKDKHKHNRRRADRKQNNHRKSRREILMNQHNRNGFDEKNIRPIPR